MSALPNPPLITNNGDYDIPTEIGWAYLLTLKGNFDGATVTMKMKSAVVDATYDDVTDGSWTADAEVNFRPTSATTRLTVSGSGAGTAIRVNNAIHRNANR